MAGWSGCWTLSRVHRTQHWEKQQAELGASYNVWQNGQAVGLYHGYIALNTWHKQQAETGDSEFVTCERIVRLLYCIRGTSYSTPGTSSKHRKERVGLKLCSSRRTPNTVQQLWQFCHTLHAHYLLPVLAACARC